MEYDNKEEYEAIKNVQNNDDSSYETLIRIYQSLIYKIIHETCYDKMIKKNYFDDLVQEGYIALYKAAKTFNFNMKLKFSTYVYIVIKRRVYHYYFKQLKEKNKIHSGFTQLIQEEESLYMVKYEKNNPHSIFMNKYDINQIKDTFLSLSDIEQSVLKMRLRNISYKEISEITGLSFRQIDYKVCKARRKIRQSYLQLSDGHTNNNYNKIYDCRA